MLTKNIWHLNLQSDLGYTFSSGNYAQSGQIFVVIKYNKILVNFSCIFLKQV